MLHFLEEPRKTGKAKTSASITSQMAGVQIAPNRDFERSVLCMLKEMRHQIGSLARTQARLAHNLTAAILELQMY